MPLATLMREAAAGSSGFSPASIPGLAAWFDPSQLALADGAAISSLPDLSGGGNNAVQATGGKQPTFRSTGAVVTLPNGKPVMQFAGGQSLVTGSTLPNLAQPNTTFVVASNTSTTGGPHFIMDSGNGSARETLHFENTGFLNMFAGSVVASTVTQPMAVSSLCAQYNGASSFIRRGGVQVASGNPGSAATTGITLGGDFSGNATQFLTGLIGEVIVVHAAMTLAAIQQVEAYLLDKWGV